MGANAVRVVAVGGAPLDTVKVILFPTCLVDLLRPSAAESSERVLARAGYTVEWREGAVCCGQPAWNSGHVEQARRVGQRVGSCA